MEEAAAQTPTDSDSPGDTVASIPPATASETSVIELAKQTAGYVRAWGNLVASEAALAKVNLIRLLLLALIVPAIALSALLCLNALLVTVLHRWLEWSVAIGVALLVNIGLMVGAGVLLQRWWRTLSLPRSRAAFSRFLEGLQ